MATVTLPYTLTAGTPENVNNLMANLNALVAGANTVDTAQIAAQAVTSAKLAVGATSATYVTTLPSSAVDGQEIYYQSTTAGTGGGSTSMADVGAVWHLRYRSAASGSYKWEFVGGTPTSHQNGGGSTTCAVAFTAYPPVSWTSPTVKVPLAGSYTYSLVVNMTSQTGATSSINYQNLVGSTTGALIGQAQTVVPVGLFGVYYVGGLCGQDSAGDLAVSETLSYAQASFSAGNAVTINHCRIVLTPVRVG